VGILLCSLSPPLKISPTLQKVFPHPHDLCGDPINQKKGQISFIVFKKLAVRKFKI